MARKPNNPNPEAEELENRDAAPLPNDPAPEPDDDLDPEPQPEPQPEPRAARLAGDEDEREPAEPEPIGDETRDSIVQRYRAKRQRDIEEERAREAQAEEEDEEGAGGGDPDESNLSTDHQDRNAGGDAEPPLGPAAAPAEGTEIELKINGKIVKKPLSEVISLAQVGAAGDSRLEEAKRVLEEAQATAQALRGQQTEHPPAGPGQQETREPEPSQARHEEPEHQPAPAIDREKLDDIVERIQLGTPEEGAQALADLTDFMKESLGGKPNVPDQDAIAQMVHGVLSQNDFKRESDTALQRFADQYPSLAKNEVLAQAGKTVLCNEIAKDLKSVGLTDQDLAPIRGNAGELAKVQRQLRNGGHQLRTFEKVLDDVGAYMTETFHIQPANPATPNPQPAPGSQQQPQRPQIDPARQQERIGRKRAAPQQPRTAGVKGQAPQAPRPKTRSDIIREQRISRGFPVTR